MTRCYVCGSTELAAGHDPRNPTCAQDLGARAHIVSMRRAQDGDSLALCICGWESQVAWSDRGTAQDQAVRSHWLALRYSVPA